uniref:Uncharacterized protein n=1 Tax=Oryza rufipogon TaxID=4529 RepID=A0A0E0PD61_ORYRU
MIARKSKVLSPSLLALPLSLSSLAFDPTLPPLLSSLPHLRFGSSGEGEQRRGSAAQRMGGSRREGYLVIDLAGVSDDNDGGKHGSRMAKTVAMVVVIQQSSVMAMRVTGENCSMNATPASCCRGLIYWFACSYSGHL